MAHRSLTEDDLRMAWRSRVTDTKDLRGVTLACIDCVNPTLAAMALDVSRRGLRFGRVVLFSHEPPRVWPTTPEEPEGDWGSAPDRVPVEWVQTEKLDLRGYNVFCLFDLHKHIDTSHVLTIHTDGFPLKPWLWRDEWLQYDYIGAPWPAGEQYAFRSRVGNSGFCLRSRRLLEATESACGERGGWPRLEWGGEIRDDVATCHLLHGRLGDVRIAPPEVAAQFSVEHPTEYGADLSRCFGFHGSWHLPTKALAAELPAWEARTAWRQRGGTLLTIYGSYTSGDAARNAELTEAARHRAQYITTCGVPDDLDGNRATFADMIRDCQLGPDDITVLINADCYVDGTILDACLMGPNDFWCLTRRDVSAGQWKLWDVSYSQDAWVFRGPPKFRPEHLQFPPGTVGCDNVIAYQAREAGYRVLNPSHDIRVFHLHANMQQRSMLTRLPAPYLFVRPHKLGEEPRTQLVETFPADKGPDWMGKAR